MPASSVEAVDDVVEEGTVVETAKDRVVVAGSEGADRRRVVAVVELAGSVLAGAGGGVPLSPRAAVTRVGKSVRTRW